MNKRNTSENSSLSYLPSRLVIQRKPQNFPRNCPPFSSKTMLHFRLILGRRLFKIWSCSETKMSSHQSSRLVHFNCLRHHSNCENGDCSRTCFRYSPVLRPLLFGPSSARPFSPTSERRICVPKIISSIGQFKPCCLVWWNEGWKARLLVIKGSQGHQARQATQLLMMGKRLCGQLFSRKSFGEKMFGVCFQLFPPHLAGIPI